MLKSIIWLHLVWEKSVFCGASAKLLARYYQPIIITTNVEWWFEVNSGVGFWLLRDRSTLNEFFLFASVVELDSGIVYD